MFLRHPRGWWWAESYLTDIFVSCSRGVSEETKWSEKLGLEGKFLLLSHWLKNTWRYLIGCIKISDWLIFEGPWLVNIGQSKAFLLFSTNERAVGTFLLNLISQSHQSLLRLRCSRTYVWSVFRSLLIIIHWDASRTLVVRSCILSDFDVARPFLDSYTSLIAFTHSRGCLVAMCLFWDSATAGHMSDMSSDMILLSIIHWDASKPLWLEWGHLGKSLFR